MLWEGHAEIKLEKALKIMEFATEYNTIKAFKNNCPLKMAHPDAQDIMSELNSELEPTYQRPLPVLPTVSAALVSVVEKGQERERAELGPKEPDPLSAFLPPEEKPKSP